MKLRRRAHRSARLDGLERRVAELEERLDHERRFPCDWPNRRVRDHFGNEVQGGPFRGMAYPDWALTQVDLFSAKVIGSYECELHDAVEELIETSPKVILNIGSAEGFYAIGLALRLQETTVVAYDTDRERLSRLRAIAELNGAIDRIKIVERPAHHDDLQHYCGPDTAVVCDCDGAELELLDPVAAPALREVAMLVEAHDLLRPGISDVLASRFECSHAIARIPTRQRFVDDYPQLGFMPLATQQLAISEFRGAPMDWLVMWPRRAASTR
jgi:hypothetical protein